MMVLPKFLTWREWKKKHNKEDEVFWKWSQDYILYTDEYEKEIVEALTGEIENINKNIVGGMTSDAFLEGYRCACEKFKKLFEKGDGTE